MRWSVPLALLAAMRARLAPPGPPHDEWDDKLAERKSTTTRRCASRRCG